MCPLVFIENRDNVDWMYKQDKPDTEEYLLGRRIDKHVDTPPEENKSKCAVWWLLNTF